MLSGELPKEWSAMTAVKSLYVALDADCGSEAHVIAVGACFTVKGVVCMCISSPPRAEMIPPAVLYHVPEQETQSSSPPHPC
jgi:hypothetical protein